MRTENRTALQVDANDLDLAMFRLVGCMEDFATTYRDAAVDEAAGRLSGARGLVRKHMHKTDQEATNG